MKDEKSSSDLISSEGVRGSVGGGGENSPQQTHLFCSLDPLWQVIEKGEEKIWNEGFKIFESFPYYIKTRPLDWKEPEPAEGLPWEQ